MATSPIAAMCKAHPNKRRSSWMVQLDGPVAWLYRFVAARRTQERCAEVILVLEHDTEHCHCHPFFLLLASLRALNIIYRDSTGLPVDSEERRDKRTHRRISHD